MALTISTADVKRKCMLASADTTYDASIAALIAEMQPAVEYTLDDDTLGDTANAGLQAVLRLGVLELIAAEFLAQRFREAGYAEEVQIGGIRLGQVWERGKVLSEQGSARLAPFRKAASMFDADSGLMSTTRDRERQMTVEEAI